MADTAALLNQLPNELRSIGEKLPAESQALLVELVKRYNLTEDDVDAFLANRKQKDLTAENLVFFKSELQERPGADPGRRPTPTPGRAPTTSALAAVGMKRKAPTASLMSGFNALRGPAAAKTTSVEATTPSSKRPREDAPLSSVATEQMGEPARGTPDPPPKPVQVILKASLHDKLVPQPSSSSPQKLQDSDVILMGDPSLWTASRPGMAYAWMDESIAFRAEQQLSRRLLLEEELVLSTRAAANEEEVPLGIFGSTMQSEVVLVGQIMCDGMDGKLNERSLILQGPRRGAQVQLNIAACKHAAVFPGQLVAVIGRSGVSGDIFHARELVPGLPLIRAPTHIGTQSLHAVVASGPYCLRDSLDYSPLDHLLDDVAARRPQVLILQGPFLDANNVQVASGETRWPGKSTVLSYEELYSQHILPKLLHGLATLRKALPMIRIFIVPSLDEALCFHPLPQPPLDVGLCLDAPALKSASASFKGLGVDLLPNPAHLQIAGLRVSLCSADALSPLLKELVLRPAGRKKIEESFRLLLQQRTLFPVLPRDPAKVSEARAAALDFPDGCAPDLCVLPSAAGVPSGIVVDGTVFINPGQLCKAVLGTFAELWVLPPGDGPASSTAERTRVDIQKLTSER
eukprot:CAMPEP_0178411582 /NCGR_PEP_ID=MMETSP0689_2-20121128/21566_1 /TAXON_ID=160604 /ORGANISM="Amphidinium massartii, Strain CS-259" /LENGTH=631 /DNA_ID=CAMNT_0020032787 /DNA_START=68 /DNA_END=1963 /DNA_ORIENTATION=+